MVDEPTPLVSQQHAPIGHSRRGTESGDYHISSASSDRDSDFSISDLI